MQTVFAEPNTTSGPYGQIEAAAVPAWVYTDSFTFGAWVKRSAGSSTSFRSIFIVENLLLVYMSSTSARVSIMEDGATAIVSASVGHTDYNDEWVFICGSWNRSTNAIVCVVQSESKARTAGTGTKAPGTHTPGSIYFGRDKEAGMGSSGTTALGWTGPLGAMSLRSGAATQAELEAWADAAWTTLTNPGQTGLYDPTIPITYAGAGVLGLLSPKWIGVNCTVPQRPLDPDTLGVTDGARVGDDTTASTITNTNYCWIEYEDATPSNNEVENWICTYRPFVVSGTLKFIENDTTFFGMPSPALGTDGNNGVASNQVRRLKARAFVGRECGLSWSNSRGASDIAFDGGPEIWGSWPGNHACGRSAAFYDKLGGMVNVPIDTGTQNHPIFPQPAVPELSGSFTNAQSSATWGDHSRDWTNSGNAASTGPGRITVFTTNGASLTQRATKNTDTLFNGATQWRHRIAIKCYPGPHADTYDWHASDAPDVDSAGTTIDSGSGSGLNTTVQTHTFVSIDDTYNNGTLTFTLEGFVPTAIAVGHRVMLGNSKAYSSIASFETAGSTTLIVLTHALRTDPVDGEEIYFGPFGVQVLDKTYAAPTGGNVCQGLTITGDATGGIGLQLLGKGAEAVGISMLVTGTGGHDGHGYGPQMDDAFADVYDWVFDVWDVTFLTLHGGTQNSTQDDQMDFARLSGLPAANVILVGDMVHKINDATNTGTWNTAILAQTEFPGIVATNASGSLMWALGEGKRREFTHPGIEHFEFHERMTWSTASDGIPAEPSATGAGRAPRTVSGRIGRALGGPR